LTRFESKFCVIACIVAAAVLLHGGDTLRGDAGFGTVPGADCTEALVTYEITSLDISGQIPILRIVSDNVPVCEAVAGP